MARLLRNFCLGMAAALVAVPALSQQADGVDPFACTRETSPDQTAIYAHYVDNFTLQNAGPDRTPGLLTAIGAQLDACAAKEGWDTEHKSAAFDFLVGTLMERGAWSSMPLRDGRRGALTSFVNSQGDADLAAYVGADGPSNSAEWTQRMTAATGIEADSPAIPYISAIMASRFVQAEARARLLPEAEEMPGPALPR